MNFEINNNERYLLMMSLVKAGCGGFDAFKDAPNAIQHDLVNRLATLKELPPPTPVEESHSSVVGRSAEPGRGNPPSTTNPKDCTHPKGHLPNGECVTCGEMFDQHSDSARFLPRQQGGTAAARAILAPVQATLAPVRAILAPSAKEILWVDGKARPDAGKGCFVVLAVQRKDVREKARLVLRTSDGKTISLWDKDLFDAVASKVNITWTYYLATSKDGKYTNLVGMEKP